MRVTTLTFSAVGLTSAALYNQVIDTAYGPVSGIPAFSSQPSTNISNWADITVWKGIPFAADTSGPNRFRRPQPRSPWNSTFYANEFGATCPGQASFGMGPAKHKRQMGSSENTTTSEDCLNLNIWTSANSTQEKRPVMIWSYPAGGSAAQALFDGAGMAAQGVVYVNYNYRNGAFGWLAHPELNAEMLKEVGHNVSGNWAMLDQFAVLKWIHENIASFGGDPERITIAGQSAGSAATYHMLNSPLTKGLIAGAIIESGVRYPRDPLCATLAENYRNMSTALSTGETLMQYFNASSIADLRALTMEELNAYSGGDFGAVLDYWALPDTYLNTLLHGAANDVPVLTGNTKDESGATLPINKTVAQYKADLQTQYGDEYAAKFLALFPAANDTQAGASFNAHYAATSRVGTWLWASVWNASPAKSPVWTYFWDHAPPGQEQGAYHESEINYVLNNLYGTDKPWATEDFDIARKMNGYWVNFVKYLDPNVGDGYVGQGRLANWEESSEEAKMTMEVGDGWGRMSVATDEQIGLFEEWFGTQKAF